MHEVVLVIHLILALAIIALVLIQRSSGGGLGIGGGSGGMGDFATARGAANALTKATTICAFMFFATSLSLAYMGKGAVAQGGLLSGVQAEAPALPETSAAAQPADGKASPADTITEPAPGKAVPAAPEPPVSKE